MEIVTVHTSSSDYRILIGEPVDSVQVRRFANGKTCLVVTDSNLAPLYLGKVRNLLESAGAGAVYTLSFPAGEKSKTLDTVAMICRTAAFRHLNRNSLIVALGGGVTGDMAGFAAAIYMRGINFIQMPTSLLAMVDSSVGGKTGADIPEGKNLIGAFHQPLAVFADTGMLETLPDREFRCGMAEIIKMAATLDLPFFEELEKHTGDLHDKVFLNFMIRRSCELKADIVSRDEKEGSIRAYLNFGHTFGHALESLSGFALPHGEGVATGIKLALRFGITLGITNRDHAERVCSLIDRITPVPEITIEPDAVLAVMASDKKALDGGVRFVMMPELGKAALFTPSTDQILNFLRSCK